MQGQQLLSQRQILQNEFFSGRNTPISPPSRRAGIAGTQAWRTYPLARGPKSSQVLVITDSNGFGERQLFLEYSYR